jgi:predicted phage terminase large subunit-like protein
MMVDFGDMTAAGEKPCSTLAWGRSYLPAYFVHPPSAMHRWLGRQLDGLSTDRGSKINVIGPRGSAKSTVATLCYVLRAALEGWEPYIWIVSDTGDQARIHLDNLRIELCDNDLLKRAYPSAKGRGRHWRSSAIQLVNDVTIESYGTGQRIRGRRRRASRPTLIVCDDLQNDSHIASARQREATGRWFQGTLLNAGTPKTNVVNVATALHRDALALALTRTAGWTSRTFAAIETWPTDIELWNEWEAIYCDNDNPHARQAAREFYERRKARMDAGAVVLWQDVEDLYTLMRLRVEIGRTAFDREKQGLPVNPDICEWPEAYFGEHIWFDVWPNKFTVRTIALDPSKGGDAGCGDYSAYALLGIDPGGVLYVEGDLARRPTPQMVADGVALCLRFRPNAFGVEANQFQELLCGEFTAEFGRQRVFHIAPAAIHNYTNKAVRIRRLGPYLAQHRLRFLRASPSTRLVVDQLRDFPAGAHDDGPDALEMALRLAEEILHGRHASDGLGNRLPVG